MPVSIAARLWDQKANDMAEQVTLADLVRSAMARKSQALGEKYNYRDLARDSGRHWSYVRNIAVGIRPHPPPEVIHDITRALAPYLDEQAALVAAGHAPPALQQAVARLHQLEREREALEESLTRWLRAKFAEDAREQERRTGMRVAASGAPPEGWSEVAGPLREAEEALERARAALAQLLQGEGQPVEQDGSDRNRLSPGSRRRRQG